MKRIAIHLKDILPGVSVGLVIGILIIFIELSFSALIFSGELTSYLAEGIGILLFGTFVVGLAGSLTSSFPSTIIIPQDTPTAISAIIGAAIAAEMTTAPSRQVFATVVAAILLTTCLVGAFFWLMGHFNLGRLVRFIPYPVVGGFLGGTGWLLLTGGIGVMTDTALGLALFQPAILLRWLPGLIYGLSLLLLLRRYSHFLLMPTFLFAGIGVFYLVYFLAAGSIQEAQAQGWLLGPFPDSGPWQPVIVTALTQANWVVVLKNAASIATIILVSTVSLLLNTSGLEITSQGDIDLNRELKSSGLANILAGLGGSPGAYPALSLSALGFRLGANSRLVGIVSSLVAGLVLLLGASTLSVFPRMIAGGFLVFLGFSFLIEWTYDAWFKLPKADYLLIWLILIVVAAVGFLEGIAVGIFTAIILFVLKYSRIQVVRHSITGAKYQSHVMRPNLYQQLLRDRGRCIHILELQGFIFFGSAQKLLEQVKELLRNRGTSAVHYLLLDFRLVTGIDSSASFSFARLEQISKAQKVKLVFTHLSPDLRTQFGKALLVDTRELHLFSSMDLGVAWCEEQLIQTLTEVGLAARPKTLLRLLEENLPGKEPSADWVHYLEPGYDPADSPNFARLKRYFSCLEVPAGQEIIAAGDRSPGVYFVEKGQVSASLPDQDNQQTEVRLLESGTVFGEIDYYLGQDAGAGYTASQPGVLFHISAENMAKMDQEDPELAIVFHRFIASVLGKKLVYTSAAMNAFRR